METECNSIGTPVKIRKRKPFDMHQHLRQGSVLQLVAPMVAKRFAGAIIMPNLTPPITTAGAVFRYHADIVDSMATGAQFQCLMTMYLTDTLHPAEVELGITTSHVHGVKYYPRGLTTNSDSGVKDSSSLWTKGTKPYDVLRVLAAYDKVLLLHAADGYATAGMGSGVRHYRVGDELDPYDQELHFILNTLPRIREAHPNLKISVEHLSTSWGVEYVRKHGGDKLGCSLTAQHLLLDRRDSFRGGFRPHKFWWPIIQPKEHRDELRRFAAEGHPFVWLGSDSAPHPVGKKETDCCTGGVLMAHAGIELYVEAFEDIGALYKLEDFASINGPKFYGIKPSSEHITLLRETWKVENLFFSDDCDYVHPFRLGEDIRWKLAD